MNIFELIDFGRIFEKLYVCNIVLLFLIGFQFQQRRWQAMPVIWTSTRLSSIWLSMVEIQIFSIIMHTKSSLLPEEVMIISNFSIKEKSKKLQEPWNTKIWLHSILVVSFKVALWLADVMWSHLQVRHQVIFNMKCLLNVILRWLVGLQWHSSR